jgi:hypothetical protein
MLPKQWMPWNLFGQSWQHFQNIQKSDPVKGQMLCGKLSDYTFFEKYPCDSVFGRL